MTASCRSDRNNDDAPPTVRALFEEHAPFVWRSLRRLGVPAADLEDMLQEVFVVVHRRLGDYEERARIRSWLYSICARTAVSHRRKLGRRRESLTGDVPEQLTNETQLHSIEQREALALGQRLLALLPPEQREVFVLHEVEQMTVVEIAEAVGCPLQTAYSRLRTARQRVLSAVTAERAKGGSDA